MRRSDCDLQGKAGENGQPAGCPCENSLQEPYSVVKVAVKNVGRLSEQASWRGLSAAWCGSAVREKESIELHTSKDDDSRMRGKCGTPMVTDPLLSNGGAQGYCRRRLCAADGA